MGSRFAVGIDLGTTNTVVAFGALDDPGSARIASVFAIPQVVGPGEVAARSLLPSLLYAPVAGEAIDDPFGDAPWALGAIAARRGADVPGRVVASSKSWLVHPGVDRTAAILPWGAPDDSPRMSPVEAAERLLTHLRAAWDAAHPDAKLAEQDVVLTVPASFDEVARELTIEAARRAGLSPKLLEEPQAAFYDWMAHAGPSGLAGLAGASDDGGDALVLVVDVGGGTTDLSVVRVGDGVTRIAVGPHVLLGGDNMDLALAHAVEPRLAGGGEKLDPARFTQLVAACRGAKEILLAAGDPPDDAPVTVVTSGAQLVGGARTTRVTRVEVERLVLDGFFPAVAADARPERARGGLVAFGLPYERDAAITRHVAAFLRRHLAAGVWPGAVLLNGGVFRAERIATRLLETLGAWRGAPVRRLPDADPDLAVARGAVAYARARRGRGVRIGGGSARGYFVAVAAEGDRPRAVCVVPRGAQEGTVHAASGRTFALAVGRPVRFELYASDDVDAQAGDALTIDDERFARLPPVTTTIAAGAGADRDAEVRVTVEGELSPVGTVDLACVEASGRRHRLAFQLRALPSAAPGASSRAPAPPSKSPRRLEPALELLDRVFGKPRAGASGREARDLLRELDRILGERAQWTAEDNRALFDALTPYARARRRSAEHERVFWLLAGFTARPGFGHPLDAARVALLTPLLDDKLAFPAEARGWQSFWIAWRRVSGGLDEATQARVRDVVDPSLAPADAGLKRPKRPALSLDDAWDLASSLERVAPRRRADLGGWRLERTFTDRDPRLWAAIGRIGARVPAYASVHHVVAPNVVESWLDHLLRAKWDGLSSAVPAAVAMARKTGDRARDVSDRMAGEVARRLAAVGAAPEQLRAVREVVAVEASERAAFFGDALPIGLKLVE